MDASTNSSVEAYSIRPDDELHNDFDLQINSSVQGNISDIYQPTKLHQTINFLDFYIVPVMVGIGFLGNTISFLVFVVTHLRSLSSSVYLAALAVSDNGMLLCILASWAINVNFPISHMPIWCQTFVYLSYVFSFLSVWYVVAFTVERYIAVCFPFKRSTMCTIARARVVVTSIGVTAAVMYTFGIWTSVSEIHLGQHYCHPREEYHKQVVALNNVDTVITLIVPSVTIIVLNINIARHVVSFRRSRAEILAFRGNSKMATGQGAHPQNACHGGNNAQVTRMLLVVSSIFMILNLPSHAFRIHAFIMQMVQPTWRPSYTIQDSQKLFVFIYYLNFSINFLLYSLCGQNFRSALRKLVIPETCRKRLSREISRPRSYSYTTQMENMTQADFSEKRRRFLAMSRGRSEHDLAMTRIDASPTPVRLRTSTSASLATPLVNFNNGSITVTTAEDDNNSTTVPSVDSC